MRHFFFALYTIVLSILVIPVAWLIILVTPMLAFILLPAFVSRCCAGFLSKKPRILMIKQSKGPNVKLYIKGIRVPMNLAYQLLILMAVFGGTDSLVEEMDALLLKRGKQYHLVVRNVCQKKCQVQHFSSPEIKDILNSVKGSR